MLHIFNAGNILDQSYYGIMRTHDIGERIYQINHITVLSGRGREHMYAYSNDQPYQQTNHITVLSGHAN